MIQSSPPATTTSLQIGAMTLGGRLFEFATSETRPDHDGFVNDDLELAMA